MSLNVKDILSAAAADGEGAPVLVEDFGDIVIDIATASSANGTIKIYGSISQDPPDFTAAQSVSNMYDTLQVVDLEDGSNIGGDTGIAAAGTDIFRQVEINTNHIRWVNVVLSSYVAGAFTVRAKASSKRN